MREIKFRAWNKITRVYLYSDNWEGTFKLSNLFTYAEDLPDVYEVEQFTGMHDATKFENLTTDEQIEWLNHHTKEEWAGKEIYEGDIIEFFRQTKKLHGRVVYDPSYAHYKIDVYDGFFGTYDGYFVIGNIHENPELISEGK